MTFMKYLLSLVMVIGFSSAAFAYTDNEELNEKDWMILREFINSKRTEEAQSKGCELVISGDVRTEWRHLNEKGHKFEKKDGQMDPGSYQKLRGGNSTKYNGNRVSRNDFDIEFNLRFEYVCERSWAVAHLQFDNSGGVDGSGLKCSDDPQGWHGSGDCDDVCLKRAYWGYNLYNTADTRIDVEVGRRNMYTIFDSRIQFLSRFDGILLKYSTPLEFAKWYWNWGGFVIDERCNQFSWVTETGLMNVFDSGFDFKYSFIHWPAAGRNACKKHNPDAFKFLNSQFTAYYHFEPEFFGKPAYAYGAFVINHGPAGSTGYAEDGFAVLKRGRGKNKAWYLGLTVGEMVKEGDWVVDVRYEWVQAFSIPDEDAAGICRGNLLNTSFTRSGAGNTNYQGLRVEGLYALTDNLTLDTIWEFSHALNKRFGGRHSYSKFELEAIYAF